MELNLTQNMTVNVDRLWQTLEDMGQIGGTPLGGCNRQALTELDREGRDLFCTWCKDAGMSIGIDSMGNIFARRSGTDPDALPVATGSHLDTQPTGGKYDGVFGVLAGLEVVRTLNDLNVQTRRPIDVIVWTNEEGTRFPPAMVSSGVFAGVYDEAWAKAIKDVDGVTFGEALTAIGYDGPEETGARKFHTFYELHIEQGPILEDEEIEIGIVTHGQGFHWFDVTLTGRESHAGTTPMHLRADALVGAAKMVDLVNTIPKAHSPQAVGTVGYFDVLPNSRNTIPGVVKFSVDLRHSTQEMIDAMSAEFMTKAQAIADEIGLKLETEHVGSFNPVAFDTDRLEIVRTATETLQLAHRDIISGAGHDACYIARVAPSAMIFCPCIDGISHNEVEAITPGWAQSSSNVLLLSMAESAEIIAD